MGIVLIGTSGWSYEHWRSVFYPSSLPRGEWLNYYATHFNTVELNSSFYHLPFEGMIKSWRKRTPENFIFAVKGHRTITHIKKLKGIEESLSLFYQRIEILKEKLGTILFQLPPSLHYNPQLLESFLTLLSSFPHKHVIEFRHNSWDEPKTYKLLEKYGVAYCIISAPKQPCVIRATTDIAYIRFHGITSWYDYYYTSKDIDWWVEKIKKLEKDGAEKIYAYFNNDAYGYAIENAKELKEKLNS